MNAINLNRTCEFSLSRLINEFCTDTSQNPSRTDWFYCSCRIFNWLLECFLISRAFGRFFAKRACRPKGHPVHRQQQITRVYTCSLSFQFTATKGQSEHLNQNWHCHPKLQYILFYAVPNWMLSSPHLCGSTAWIWTVIWVTWLNNLVVCVAKANA